MDQWEVIARESVRHTIAAYNFGGDRGVLEELAAAFTPDGTLQIGDDLPIEGRDAIVAQLGSVTRVEPAPTSVHHHVAGIHFRSVTTAVIETSSYFQVLTDVGLDHWGRYRDRFVPSGDRWLLASRRVITDGFSADSFFR
jgi:SnoaL-like domain